LEIIFWTLILAVSLYVLNKSSEYFTDYAERFGILFGLPSFVIGVSIVSIGTSLPELVTGIVAALKGGEATSFVIANVVGSNITNILLIIGIASVVVGYSIKVRKDLVKLDLPLLSLSTALFVVLLVWDQTFSFSDALISMCAYGIYLWYTFSEHSKTSYSKPKKKGRGKLFLGLAVSALFIWLGAKYTIESVLMLGAFFRVNVALLGLTVVALGTSLPELFVTLAAVRKKRFEIAVGNIFGSNIVNLLFVVAIPAFITPLVITTNVLLVGIPFLVLATLLYVIASLDREVQKYEGAMFLLIYLVYISILFTRALI